MRRFFAMGILLLSISIATFGQTQTLQLQDEFGEVSLEVLMARLDGLASNVYSRPKDEKIMIRISGGNSKSFAGSYLRGGIIYSYLLRNRGLSPKTFDIDYCNINKESLLTQIYIYPEKQPFYKCTDKPEVPKKSILFAEALPYLDGFGLDAFEEMDIEIGETNGQYSKESLKILKRFLGESPESKVYVITILGKVYEDYRKPKIKVYKKTVFKKMKNSAKEVLLKNGIKISQIQFVKAEKPDEYQKFEFWFVPKGGEIPNQIAK